MISNYNAERLIRLYDSRWAALGNWRNRWEEISQFVMPQQRSFTTQRAEGDQRGDGRIFDSTALEANERLATRLHEAMSSPATNWFNLRFQDEDLLKDNEAQKWLDKVELTMIQAIRRSNFDMVMGQFYLDLPCLGSSAVSCDEKKPKYATESTGNFQGLNFTHLHLGRVAVAENADGAIDEVAIQFEMTADQCTQRWGDNAPEPARNAMENGEPDKKFKILLSRFPRMLKKKPPAGGLLPPERPFAEVWIFLQTREVIDDNGTYEQAVFIGRWRKRSDDIMGYGPGERALPTIRTVNESERLELAAWAKAIDPPMKTTNNNVIGDLNVVAGGITNLRKFEELATLDIDPDLNHHMIELEDKRFQIRDIFKYHSLELPPREQTGEMTAYEVSKRVEQIYRALGPAAVQLQADVLNGLVERVFGIMIRKGAFPEMPESVKEKANLEVAYVGPMALAARATEIEAVDRFTADALALAQAGLEDAMDVVDVEASQRYKAEIMGVPAAVIRSETDVEVIREERKQAQEQAAQQQSAINESEALKNTGDAVGQEALANMMGQEA